QRFEYADVHPAYVELVPLVRQLGRCRESVMVVVQLLATDEDAPRHDVGAAVGGRRIAITPVMADAVDHASRPERNPGDLRQENQGPGNDAERDDVGQASQRQSELHVLGVDVALEPIVGGTVTVALDRRAVAGLLYVQQN